MSVLWQDVRYGLRMMTHHPGFTTLVVITLALGIGANASLFSFVHAVLLQPLPFERPGQLVMVWESGQPPLHTKMQELNQESRTLQAAASMIANSVNLTGREQPVRVRGGFVSDSFFAVVGVKAARGRVFREGDDRPGAEPVAVVNHRAWENVFGADPDLLGKTVLLNNEPYTVVGIMPPDFVYPIDDVDVWIPLHKFPSNFRRAWWNIARVDGDFTLRQAQAELDSLSIQLAEKYSTESEESQLQLQPMHSWLVRDERPTLLLLMGTVGMVLLIACANVANLLLARGAAREREMAVRVALGASQARLIRQTLTEAALLSLTGAAVGLLAARWGIALLNAAFPGSAPSGQAAALNPSVLGFTVVLALLTGLLFGLAPALRFARPSVTDGLKEGGRGAGGGLRRQRLSKLLVIAQTALALILLTGSGLLIRSLVMLERVEPGFDTSNLLTMEYRLPRNKYPQGEQQWAMHREVVERVRALPGVESAAMVKRVPFSGNRAFTNFTIPGQPAPSEGQEPMTFVNTVSVGGLETLGVPLLRGRTFTEQDEGGAPIVIVINQTMAERYWPGREAIGKQVHFPSEGVNATVIGVVGDIKYFRLEERTPPQVYVSFAQDPGIFTTLVVRTHVDPMSLGGAVREAVWSVDKDQPVWKIRTVDSLIERSFANRRFMMAGLGVFALVALALAAVGLYGVVSYSVNQRTHEMGVRMALGALPRSIFVLVVGQGLVVAVIGVIVGVAGAFGLTRFLESLLFGVTATDPATYVAVAGLLVGVALAACYVPARRATRVDPMVALRYE